MSDVGAARAALLTASADVADELKKAGFAAAAHAEMKRASALDKVLDAIVAHIDERTNLDRIEKELHRKLQTQLRAQGLAL